MTNIQDFLDTVLEREFNVSETEYLLRQTNQVIWMTWGVTKISYYASKALAIWVNGNHHVGYVAVTLAWNDTYTYYLLNQDYTVKKKATNVYFDELQNRIDIDIEFLSEYNF